MGQYHRKLEERRRQDRIGPKPFEPPPRPAPNPLKGKRDGVCNRFACQLPLAGREQWTIPNRMVPSDPFHYCSTCAFAFNSDDADMGRPFRCTVVEDTKGQFR